MRDVPARDQIRRGLWVSVETKKDQGTGRLVEGEVAEILTPSNSHPHGIKVRLRDGSVGRVKEIVGGGQAPLDGTGEHAGGAVPAAGFEDLGKREIPKVEDKYNEFKEFYQYDAKLEGTGQSGGDAGQMRRGIMASVLERFATAVCSFGNDREGGFVYLGIRADGTVAGLERDMQLGGFANYEDDFANDINRSLVDMTGDLVFVTSRVRIRFRDVGGRTVCILHVLPSDKPVFLKGSDSIFVRGPSPRAPDGLRIRLESTRRATFALTVTRKRDVLSIKAWLVGDVGAPLTYYAISGCSGREFKSIFMGCVREYFPDISRMFLTNG